MERRYSVSVNAAEGSPSMTAKAHAFWGSGPLPAAWLGSAVLLDAKRPRGYTVAACPTLTKHGLLVIRLASGKVHLVTDRGRAVLSGLDGVVLSAESLPRARATCVSDKQFSQKVKEGLGEAMVPAMAKLFAEWASEEKT